MERTLSHIIKGIPAKIYGKDRKILGLFYDSRKFEPRFAYIALKGNKTDGHKYIKELYFKGCEVFFIQDQNYINNSWDASFVLVDDTRKYMGKIARNFWGVQKAKVLGVTGTKGKSSTAKILSSSLVFSGKRCGVIGSVWWKLTTPEVVDTLSIINNSYFDYVVMEVTSIGVIQNRVDDIDFELGIFLGLGHDHLDFHKTMENYFLAKFSFIEKVKSFAVIYLDEWGQIAEEKLKGKKTVYSFDDQSVKDYKVVFEDGKVRSFFDLSWRGERLSFHSSFIGFFNWINFLSSYIVLRELGFSPYEIKDFFEEVVPPAGRMEVVNTKPYVFVDYAHTPESLESSLKECVELKRFLGRGRVIVVFGCGGDRDKEKRPKMGNIAYKMADIVIITSDNPRSEDPKKIAYDIISGIYGVHTQPEIVNTKDIDMTNTNSKLILELDRKNAIFKAMSIANEDDIILIAGKGHENYQIIGDKVINFSDKIVVQEFLSSKSIIWHQT